MRSGSAVTVEGLQKEFLVGGGRVLALAGIDLEIEAGSRVAVIGPSGCGKSTLLSLLGGLDLATSGTVTIAGETLGRDERRRAEVRRRSIGFLFQSYDLLPFLTARENIEFQLALNRQDAGGVSELLDRLGLLAHADKLPDQLSGGQRQRVGLARALATRPALVLADEPTGELDSDTAAQVMDLLLECQAEVGATLVVVTHDQDVAARLDRTVALRDGRVVLDEKARLAAGA